MKQLATLSIVLLAVASSAAGQGFTVVPTNAGPPKIHPSDSNRFMYTGETWAATGYYPGLHVLALEPNPSTAFYRQLIDQLAANKINLMRVVLTFNTAVEATPGGGSVEWRYPYLRSSTGQTFSASQHGLDRKKFDLNQFNPSFFTYWANVVNYARTKGIVVQVAFYEANHIGSGATTQSLSFFPFYHSRPYDLFDQDNNINGVHFANQNEWFTKSQIINRQQHFITEAAKYLSCHGNVIWEIANEPPGNYAAWHQTMRNSIRFGEVVSGCPGQHLIMPLNLPEHRDVAGHFTPGQNASFAGVHSGLIADLGQFNQPLIADNDCCTNPGSTTQRRQKAWTALVSGAHPSLFHFSLGPSNLASTNVKDGMKFVGNSRRFVDTFEIELAGMKPLDSAVTQVAGGPTWCLAELFDRYIVYFLNSGEAALSMLPTNFNAFWFDPRTAAVTTAMPGSGNTFTTPGSGDWVLYIEAQ